MKIVIAGSHGTGKTTLARLLARLLDLPLLPDVAVEAHQKGFAINENTPLETQFWMFAKQLEYERMLGDKFIGDKCLIDYSVYGDIVLNHDPAKRMLAELIRPNARYDFIFYLPIEFPIEDNKIRSLDPDFQLAVDRHYLEILNSWGLAYATLSGSVQDRLAQALEIINERISCQTAILD